VLFLFCFKGDVDVKVADFIIQEQRKRLNQIGIRDKPPSKKERRKEILKHEKLSRRDWEELMGQNMDTYRRVNGAWRRK